MAIAGTTQHAESFRKSFDVPFYDAVFRNDAFLGIAINDRALFPVRGSLGGTSYNWKVINSGNTTVETFTEGSSQPVTTAQGSTEASITYVYFRGMVQITGHLRDALQFSDARIYDAVALEMRKTVEDVRDLMSTTFMGATNSGLEVAIDSTTTYAGIARGSAPYWESTETAQGGVLDMAGLRNLHEGAEDNDKGGRIIAWLGPRNQLTNYAALTGEPAAANSSVRVSFGASGPDSSGGLDLGVNYEALKIDMVPFIGIPDFTDTVIAALSDNWEYRQHRRFQVKEMAPSGDSDVYQISTAGALVNTMPKMSAKLTGVTS